MDHKKKALFGRKITEEDGNSWRGNLYARAVAAAYRRRHWDVFGQDDFENGDFWWTA